MNKELFQSMQKQMVPSPTVRAELSEKLAQPAKRRPVPWMKYGAVAACAALVIGAFTIYQIGKPHNLLLHRTIQLHSYVVVEGLTGDVFESTVSINDIGGGTETGAGPNTGVLPGGAYIGDVPTQEEAIQAYDKLAPYTRPHPDWYGGAYIDDSGTLVVCLVESEDPGDKSLELKILDWTDNGRVAFTSGKYSLGYLLDLQTKVCDALYEMGLSYGCGTDEEHNRLDLTLSSITEEALVLLARLDPDDDAIYVQVGQFTTTNDLAVEDPAVHHVIPGGVIAEDDGDLIADEPWVDEEDLARYDIEELPESKLPAVVQSVPEEDVSVSTPAFDPNSGFSSSFSSPQS